MKFAPNDRVMIIAAHPDDETLASGGLIQQMTKAGAAGRVLMLTNGDNNPWPQRWFEKRWRIGAAERERWGDMRRCEALAALEKIGFTGETEFLGFPDQGMTKALLENNSPAMDALCRALREWAPTLLVLPSPHDLHPDHNAIHVLLQIALARTGLNARQLHYAVHGKRLGLIPRPVALLLDEAERARKHDAILCHKSQMLLSRKRFLAYAQPGERFFEPAPAERFAPHHPIVEARLEEGALHLRVSTPFCPRSVLWLAGETAQGKSLRWQLPLPFSSRVVPIEDIASGTRAGSAEAQRAGLLMRLKVPVATVGKLALLYMKYHRPSVFLDPSGWRQVPV